MDAQVAPYHWDDRRKLYKDFLALNTLYEEMLQELAGKLNELHGCDRSLRYWRILIGPWLRIFLEVLFDRWAMLQQEADNSRISGVRVLDTAPDSIIPSDMAHFLGLYINDSWNEAVYGALLKEWTTVPVSKEPARPRTSSKETLLAPARWLKRKLEAAAAAVSQAFVRPDEYFFIFSYLPILQDLRLQWQLGQFPKIWRSILGPKARVDSKRRTWRLRQEGLTGFAAISRAMIPRHLPTIYLEGYADLVALCGSLPWPQKPRLIFTSNSFYSDDVFKAWTADKTEKGTPLVVGQHGGNYGIGLWESLEDHQYAISDCWLSWGWSDENRPRIKPVCNFKAVGCKQAWDPLGHVLLVVMAIPRYSYRMFSIPVAGQWLGYLNDQYRFVDALSEQIRGKLIVRLVEQDYGLCQKERWEDRYPGLVLDIGHSPIDSLVSKSRIYVSTHNATTFLESMALNVPTIVFWDPDHYELRDSAIPWMEQLKSAGIFHTTPESAAQQLSKVWGDVPGWWQSKPVQIVREKFCSQYSRMTEKPLEEIAQALREVSKKQNKDQDAVTEPDI